MTTEKLAHESDDDTAPAHCPWCGSGQVLANSDGSIRCNYCQRSFTVRLQPSYPGIPQDPSQMNAGEPQLSDGSGAEQSVSPTTAEDPNPAQPPAPDTEPPEEAEEDEEDDEPPSSPVGGITGLSFRTADGHLLSYEDYLAHLAITNATDREAMIAAVRRRRQAARG